MSDEHESAVDRRTFLTATTAAVGAMSISGCVGQREKYTTTLVKATEDMPLYIEAAIVDIRNEFPTLSRQIDVEISLNDGLGDTRLTYLTDGGDAGSFNLNGGQGQVVELTTGSWRISVSPPEDVQAVYELLVTEHSSESGQSD